MPVKCALKFAMPRNRVNVTQVWLYSNNERMAEQKLKNVYKGLTSCKEITLTLQDKSCAFILFFITTKGAFEFPIAAHNYPLHGNLIRKRMVCLYYILTFYSTA